MAKNKSESKTDASTTNNTTYTDNRISAGNGGFVATDGSTINAYIESVDADVAKSAVNAAGVAVAGNTEVSKAAINGMGAVSTTALQTNADVSKYAIGSNTAVALQTLDFAAASQREILAFTDTAIARGQDMFTAAAAGESAQLTKSITDTLQKAIVVAGVVAGVLGIAYAVKAWKAA